MGLVQQSKTNNTIGQRLGQIEHDLGLGLGSVLKKKINKKFLVSCRYKVPLLLGFLHKLNHKPNQNNQTPKVIKHFIHIGFCIPFPMLSFYIPFPIYLLLSIVSAPILQPWQGPSSHSGSSGGSNGSGGSGGVDTSRCTSAIVGIVLAGSIGILILFWCGIRGFKRRSEVNGDGEKG